MRISSRGKSGINCDMANFETCKACGCYMPDDAESCPACGLKKKADEEYTWQLQWTANGGAGGGGGGGHGSGWPGIFVYGGDDNG